MVLVQAILHGGTHNCEGEYITKPRPVLHHRSGHIKHLKPAKCVVSVLLRLGDLSANQMRGTQMKLLTELV